jgi:hypothetical protein
MGDVFCKIGQKHLPMPGNGWGSVATNNGMAGGFSCMALRKMRCKTNKNSIEYNETIDFEHRGSNKRLLGMLEPGRRGAFAARVRRAKRA